MALFGNEIVQSAVTSLQGDGHVPGVDHLDQRILTEMFYIGLDRDVRKAAQKSDDGQQGRNGNDAHG